MKVSELSFTYFCTGARNQSLLDLFNPDRLSFEIDERAASFKALGYAKFSNQPAAVCTTSGTAVSECLSAMVEAYYSDVPLLLITGDRPLRMQNTGAPQTINHEAITRGYRNTYLEMTQNELQNLDLTQLVYPAHINVIIQNEGEKDSPAASLYKSSWAGFENFLNDHPRPLILVSHEQTSMRNFIARLCETGIPFYAESLGQGHDLSVIKYEKDLVDGIKNNRFTSVIRIGHTPLSKAWRMLEGHHLPVFSFDSRGLPALSYGPVLKYTSADLLNLPHWWEAIKSIAPFEIHSTSSDKFNALIQSFPQSELGWLSKLQDHIPVGSLVYVGNSLTIRFFEMIQTKELKVYGNRGANGIDGQLSSAIGIAQSTKETVYCILGDLTTLYDLSSIMSLPPNLKLIIINNNGGRIFEVMKMRQEMVMQNNFNFKALATALSLSYAQNDFDKFHEAQIFEINPSHPDTLLFLSRWQT